jgi:putative heme iron utilization protein
MLLIKVSYKGRKQTSALQREIQDHCLLHWDEVSQLLRQLSDDAFKFLICFKVADPLNVGRELDECFNIFHNVLGVLSPEKMDEVFKELNQWGLIFITTYKDAPILDEKEEAALQSFYSNTYFQQNFKADEKYLNETIKIASSKNIDKAKLAEICSNPSIFRITNKLTEFQVMLLGYLKGMPATGQHIVINPEQISMISTAFQVTPTEVNQALMALCHSGHISIAVDRVTVQVN